MFFTREDIEKIHQGLLRLGIKDSELPETINVNSDDTLAIVQDGKNKKINIEEFFNNISLFKKEGFINITDRFNKHSISLIEAIQTVPTHQRIDGLVITFEDINGDWRIYQFRGDAVDFFDENKWTDLYDYTNYIVKSITPDEEDLTVSKPDKNGNISQPAFFFQIVFIQRIDATSTWENIFFHSNKALKDGDIVKVKILKAGVYDLLGELLEE